MTPIKRVPPPPQRRRDEPTAGWYYVWFVACSLIFLLWIGTLIWLAITVIAWIGRQ